MALWPWCEAVSVRFNRCSFCGNEQPVADGNVLVCSCKKSQQAELEQREQRALWAKEQAERPKGRKAKIQ